MEYNQELFSRQYPVVVFFVQHLAYFRGLKAAWSRIKDHKEFWASTVDGHLKLATVAWCKVFGSRKEGIHWAKTPTGNIPKPAKDDFRQRVLSKTGFTPEQWETYHTRMLAFRDKYVAHLDFRNPIADPVPEFDPALQVAYAYQEWVRDLIKPVDLNQQALSALYEECQGDASAVVSPSQHPSPPSRGEFDSTHRASRERRHRPGGQGRR
jgi:hypothetical protein